jgi:membrane fusion protein (multidrug efflux system)
MSAQAAAGAPGAQTTPAPPQDTPRAKPRWPWIAAAVVIIGFVAIVLVTIFVPRPNVTTDDARVMAHYATIAPRVSGQINAVLVNDNQMVKAGQVLAVLDDRDYRTAVDMAQAQLDKDLAQAADANASIDRQPSVIDQNDAQVAQAQARVVLAQDNAKRYGNLARSGSGSQQDQQQAQAALHEEQSKVDETRAAVRASQHQVAILGAQHKAALAAVEADRASLAQAKLNLSYTRITAPVDGMIGERSAEPGNYVGPGSALMVVVPLGETYVEANYREVELQHMRPGQPVRVHIDAYDIDLDGIVDSVPPATGALFAPVGPENATGNFTKIVQRLPVKIVFKANQPGLRHLRIGMSVETTVRTGFADVIGTRDTDVAASGRN